MSETTRNETVLGISPTGASVSARKLLYAVATGRRSKDSLAYLHTRAACRLVRHPSTMVRFMTQTSATLHVGCKINLYLEIERRREDGYHDLRTLFFPLSEPHDTLHIVPASPGASMLFTCSDPELENQNNIVLKAYRAFAYVSCCAPDIEVHLDKGVPAGAGLGGGSADAARLLVHLNSLAGPRALAPERLRRLAAGLGADVPFFLDNVPAWASGVGDMLTPAPETAQLLRGTSLVLVCPDEHISTDSAYAAWDGLHEEKNCSSSPRALTSAEHLSNVPVCDRPLMLYNSFETVIFPAFPKLRLIKEHFLKEEAAAALMSGSGASLFALFRCATRAAAVAQDMQRSCHAVFVHHF